MIELIQGQTQGGFNGKRGFNNKFVASKMAWGVKTDNLEILFKRKKDAEAFFTFATSTGFDGRNFPESKFLRWLMENDVAIFDTYKGEA